MTVARSAGKVSVVISAYNAQKYIAAAIESVLAQSYPDVECIVVDDGSSDGTAEVVAAYPVRYMYQANAERSAARNRGIAAAEGAYISFLDADDLLAPEKLADQAAFLQAHQELDAVYSRVCYFHDGEEDSGFVPKRETPSGDIVKSLIYSNFITIHSPLIRRRAMERIDGFDVNFNRFEDWDFFLRLALSGAKFGFLDRLNAKVRLHGENTIRDRARMFQAKLAVAEKIVASYGQELQRRGLKAEEILSFHRADYGRVLILDGRVREGRQLVKEAMKHPFPHRQTFALFALAAAVVDYRLLVALQDGFNRLFKGRRGRKEDASA